MTHINIDGYKFEGPFNYELKFKETFPCVYFVIDSKKPIYVGITDDINERLSNHHKMDCWKRNSRSDCLYVYKESSEQNRIKIEKFLFDKYTPVCGDK